MTYPIMHIVGQRPKESSTEYERLQQARKALRRFVPDGDEPIIGFTLGSGLGALADQVKKAKRISFDDIPGFPRVSGALHGHANQLVIGRLCGARVIMMQGRIHYYQGVQLVQVVFGTRLMTMLGAKIVVPTCSVGAINKNIDPGDFMVVRDHIGSHDMSPLIGSNEEKLGPRFPDMSEVYDPSLIAIAKRCALQVRVPLHKGILFFHAGPQYETPAEIEEMRRRGGDLATMSTVPEAIAARHRDARVLAIASVVNMGAGVLHQRLSHTEVVAKANESAPAFIRFLKAIIKEIVQGEKGRNKKRKKK